MKIQIFVIVIIVSSCQTLIKKKENQQINKIQIETNSESKVSAWGNIYYDTLPNSLKILSLNKVYDSTSSSYNPEKDEMINLNTFNKWRLSKTDVIDIFENSEEISGIELDLSYAVLPVWYVGNIMINGKKGSFKINAASYIVVMIDEKIMYLGCSTINCNKYFILPANIE